MDGDGRKLAVDERGCEESGRGWDERGEYLSDVDPTLHCGNESAGESDESTEESRVDQQGMKALSKKRVVGGQMGG